MDSPEQSGRIKTTSLPYKPIEEVFMGTVVGSAGIVLGTSFCFCFLINNVDNHMSYTVGSMEISMQVLKWSIFAVPLLLLALSNRWRMVLLCSAITTMLIVGGTRTVFNVIEWELETDCNKGIADACGELSLQWSSRGEGCAYFVHACKVDQDEYGRWCRNLNKWRSSCIETALCPAFDFGTRDACLEANSEPFCAVYNDHCLTTKEAIETP